jgi:hypothetical protein
MRRAEGQRGQSIVLFALALLVILGMASIALDGGFGQVQQRRAQNGADFASVAGARMLSGLCQQGNAPSNASVEAVMQDVIDKNAPGVGANWTGIYLDSSGNPIYTNPPTNTIPYTVQDSSPGFPPNTACGVKVALNPNWAPFLAHVIGSNSLTTTANAKSVYKPNSGNGGIGIVALDEVSPHEVLGGGHGSFNVNGTIFANSTVPYDPWSSTHHNLNYVDVVDAKGASGLILHGIMQSVGGNWPLDWCFGTSNSMFNNAPDPNINPPVPDPYNTAQCKDNNGNPIGNVSLKYNQVINGATQQPDPLLPVGGTGGVPDPFDKSVGGGYTLGLCPSQGTPPVYNSIPAAWTSGGVTLLQPGDYTFKVALTNSVQFADCTGVYDANPSVAAYPGIFRFEQGLQLSPTAGKTVVGNNVMIATAAPVAIPANVPGTTPGGVFTPSGVGDGAPCFPAGVKDDGGNPETDGSHQCGGTAGLPSGPYYGVVTRHQPSPYSLDASTYGTGMNFSLILGGAGSITLKYPQSGEYHQIALFQNRSTQGNFGLDAQPNDSATVNVTGVVYNASLPCGGYPVVSGSCTTNANKPMPNPFDFWDTGTIFHSGGILQAGLGQGSPFPVGSTGSVTIHGPCIVEDFNTDGGTTILIDGPGTNYQLPGILNSGNPPIVG